MTIAVIRIKGMVKVKQPIVETLYRLKLRRKYVCVLIDEKNKELMGMVKKVRDFVAYGPISAEMEKKLIEARGKKDAEGQVKPFFRLHPPRGGIDSKVHYPKGKGVLGDNKDDINKLIERML
jgi:large subunit ribosomal protein L30